MIIIHVSAAIDEHLQEKVFFIAFKVLIKEKNRLEFKKFVRFSIDIASTNLKTRIAVAASVVGKLCNNWTELIIEYTVVASITWKQNNGKIE